MTNLAAILFIVWTNAAGELQVSTSANDAGTNAYVVTEARPATSEVKPIDPQLLLWGEIFKGKLQSYFGAGAETNRAITAEYVASHFAVRVMTKTITRDEIEDAEFFSKWFPKLSAVTEDQTTWTFPFIKDDVP